MWMFVDVGGGPHSTGGGGLIRHTHQGGCVCVTNQTGYGPGPYHRCGK